MGLFRTAGYSALDGTARIRRAEEEPIIFCCSPCLGDSVVQRFCLWFQPQKATGTPLGDVPVLSHRGKNHFSSGGAGGGTAGCADVCRSASWCSVSMGSIAKKSLPLKIVSMARTRSFAACDLTTNPWAPVLLTAEAISVELCMVSMTILHEAFICTSSRATASPSL